MVLVIIGVAIVAFLFGCGWEQSRWVKLEETKKVKEVNGKLYKAIEVEIDPTP